MTRKNSWPNPALRLSYHLKASAMSARAGRRTNKLCYVIQDLVARFADVPISGKLRSSPPQLGHLICGGRDILRIQTIPKLLRELDTLFRSQVAEVEYRRGHSTNLIVLGRAGKGAGLSILLPRRQTIARRFFTFETLPVTATHAR